MTVKRTVIFFIYLFGLTFTIAAGQFNEIKYQCPKGNLHPCNCTKATNDGLTIFCENANLPSISITISNLVAEELPIEELQIKNCHFAVLFGLILRNVDIKRLKIIDTPLEEIEDQVFLGANETLQEIEIHNSKLTSFPRAFAVLGKLVKLKLDVHNITKLEANAFANTPASQRIERLHISNGNISDVTVEFLQSLRKLKTLDLHGNHLSVLKRNQFKNLRDLEVLDISFNNITKFDSSHIADLTKLGWCNASHNALTELTRGTFARSSVLRVLRMSHNMIKRLDANSFRGMRFLRRLTLSDNRITDIGRGTFSSITRIGTIDLARNQLKKVDYQMFAQLNYMESIDLAENNITEVQKQAFKDIYLTKINMSHNAISNFENGAFENCVNITTLDLTHNRIVSFSRYTFDELSYATEWLLSFNALTNLSAVPLYNMTGLKILNVSYNEIVDIPKNAFPKLYELHTIDISHNRLSMISNAVFQTLFSLRNLNMSYNELESIKTPVLGTLPTLLELNLSNNKLKEIARSALIQLISLRTLNVENNQIARIFTIPLSLNVLQLRNNRIKEIGEKVWPTMNALLELDLSDNLIENNLNQNSFFGLLTIRHLNLNNNGISKIPKESFRTLSTLQYLYMENNNLTELERAAFGPMPIVFELNLKNNFIENISSKAFDGLLQLLKLDVSHNAIRNIASDAFMGLVSMRQLDLSYNFLKKLDNKTNGALDDCLSLERINLSHNKFSFITKKMFPSNPWVPYHLHEIDLSFNELPILSYDLAFGTHNVIKMNISHNQITEVRRNVIANWTHLEILDLSNNELSDLSDNEMDLLLPENLTHLYLAENKFHEFPVKIIKNLTILKEIDLRDNQMKHFDKKLLQNVKNGMKFRIQGNPIECNCRIRPLKHYLDTLLVAPDEFENILCHKPSILNGKKFVEISDDNLNCIEQNSTSDGHAFEVFPDLIFRDIFYYKGNLTVRWILNNLKTDIGGFYIIIRNRNSKILIEHHTLYDSRIDQIDGHSICDENGCKNLELCVLTKNGYGIINGWFDSQCVYLPNHFETIIDRYHARNEQILYIHSIVKKIQARRVLTAEDLANRQSKIHLSGFLITVMMILSLTF